MKYLAPFCILLLLAGMPSPAQAGNKIYDAVQGKLVALDGRVLAPMENTGRVANARYYAIYYGSLSDEASKSFLPNLVSFYEQVKNPNFDIIFISADEDEFAMEEHMLRAPMLWPAVRYSDIPSVPFSQFFKPSAVPHLIFLTADGKVISSNVRNGQVGDPNQVLRDMAGKLGN